MNIEHSPLKPLFDSCDLATCVFSHCGGDELVELQKVSKFFQNLISGTSTTNHHSEIIWKAALMRKFPIVGTILQLWSDQTLGPLATDGYKSLYKRLQKIGEDQIESKEQGFKAHIRYAYLTKLKEFFETLKTSSCQEPFLSMKYFCLTPERQVQWLNENPLLSIAQKRSLTHKALVSKLLSFEQKLRESVSGKGGKLTKKLVLRTQALV